MGSPDMRPVAASLHERAAPVLVSSIARDRDAKGARLILRA